MKRLKRRLIQRAAIGAAIMLMTVSGFSFVVHAGTLEHNPAFSCGSSSVHRITYTTSTVSAYSEIKGLSQNTYRLMVSGTAYLSNGSACGGYYGTSVVDPGSWISVQSNYGACTGIPQSASGTAALHYCTVLSGGAVVLGAAIEYDLLP